MSERLNISSQFNKRITAPVISVKRCVYKTSRFICSLFILNVIVQGTSFESGNSNLPVSVLHKHGNPITSVSVPTASETGWVAMQHQPDWVTELEDTVEKEEKIDLSKLDLEKLPACLKRAEKLKELDISSNRLKAVPLELLGANKGLEKLDISDNRDVAILEEGSALKGLKCLRAEICGWKLIPASVGQFSQLEKLYLPRNRLESFDPELFLKLPSLKVLDLSENEHITFGSSPWTSLKGLGHLLLRETGLDEIPNSIGTLENLISLDVSYNQLKRLDPEMFSKLGCLKELNIGYNMDLVIDDPTWESLKGLRSLRAQGIGMTKIPTGLKQLTKLQKLHLWNNEIPVLNPADFAEFPDLEDLEFGHMSTTFKVVTTGWGHLKSLKKLVINGSTLEVLDDWVGELQSLEELNLNYNMIHDIKDGFFAALSKLPNFRVLSLDTNLIYTVPRSILLLKDKNVTISLRNNDIDYEPSKDNVGRAILKDEFGENIVLY